jgi:zinc transporter ZupT
MYLIDAGLMNAGLMIAYAILITQALAGVADILPLSGSDPVEGL